MRMIDGDAKNLNPETINGINLDTAIKVVENFLSSDECKSPLHAYLCAVRDFAEWYRDELKNAPTVDAVPVVRGEWSNEIGDVHSAGKYRVCSACGKNAFILWSSTLGLHGVDYNFCPNCGADNRGSEVKE